MSSTEDQSKTEASIDEQLLARDIQKEVETGFLVNLVGFPLLLIYFVFTFYKVATAIMPYQFIDERFHVNQTINYIRGAWTEWDPKITTPPGLYLLGWLNYHLTRFITSWSTLTVLRLVNLVGGIIVWPWVVLRPLFLFNAIGFWPVTLMCFPLMATYYYLYYTDVWSTIFIVESLTLAITLPFGETASIWLSALCGLISCFFRQTNIVWNLFVMVVVVERRALINKDFNNVHFNNYLKFIIHILEHFKSLALPYVINFVLFLGFVIYNRSITLGDKENHVAGLHLVQIFYGFAFIVMFSFPIWISKGFIENYLRRISWKPIQTVFELLGIILVIRYFTVIHPFLLADNRHYTFYLFKKIFGRNKWFKYLIMPPVYHFATYTYLEVIKPSIMYFHPILPIEIKDPVELPVQLTHISWTTLILCTIMTISPSPLFEPRYYILPFLFWRLFITVTNEPLLKDGTTTSTKRLFLELLWFMAINVVTLVVLTRYSFRWDTEPNPQRIIW